MEIKVVVEMSPDTSEKFTKALLEALEKRRK